MEKPEDLGNVVEWRVGPALPGYFSRKISGREREKGIKTKMRVKVAAKILVMAWTLMKKGATFQPEHLNN